MNDMSELVKITPEVTEEKTAVLNVAANHKPEQEYSGVEIRSEEVQEIVSQVPGWMIRWGISVIFILMVLIIIMSWFISYPDVIQGETKVSTEVPPARLINESGGYLNDLFVTDNTKVKKGQTIATITNPASKEHIDELKNLIEILEIEEEENLEKVIKSAITSLPEMSISLGEVQGEYNSLITNLKEYLAFLQDAYYKSNLRNLSKQIAYNKQLLFIQKEQIKISRLELKNAEQKFTSDSTMFEKGYIAKHEYFTKQSELNNKKNELINLRKSVVQQRITVANYEKQKNELELEHLNKQRYFENNLLSNKKNIQSFITSWSQRYTIVSPFDGELSYLGNVTKNQFVPVQTELFAVIPNNQNYMAEVMVAGQGYGKVELGQKVRIKLANYPYQEFGQLWGVVANVAQVPYNNGYVIKIELPEKLITSYNKEIEYTPDMVGVAEIVTDDVRLLERVFNSFRKIFDE